MCVKNSFCFRFFFVVITFAIFVYDHHLLIDWCDHPNIYRYIYLLCCAKMSIGHIHPPTFNNIHTSAHHKFFFIIIMFLFRCIYCDRWRWPKRTQIWFFPIKITKKIGGRMIWLWPMTTKRIGIRSIRYASIYILYLHLLTGGRFFGHILHVDKAIEHRLIFLSV